MIKRWDTVQSYVETVMAEVPPSLIASAYRDSYWDGDVSPKEAAERAIKGDLSLVESSTKVVDKIVAEKLLSVDRAKYVPGVQGTRVAVPDYLSGTPYCMRRRTRVPTLTRSVRIYVCMTSSCGVSATNLIVRGTTILGLLSFLQSCQVAVELYLVAQLAGRDDGAFYQVIKVESNPLDLSTACFAIAHPAFDRHLTHIYSHHVNKWSEYGVPYGNWPKTFEMRTEDENNNHYKGLKKLLELGTTDVLVTSPLYSSALIMTKPEEWLEKQLKQIGVVE